MKQFHEESFPHDSSKSNGVQKASNASKIFKIIKTQYNARCGVLELKHGRVETPAFMPVGTQGALKGILSHQMKNALRIPTIGEEFCDLILGNTYHLGLRPGDDLLKKFGGLQKYSNWSSNILTDSGGFQLVSLKKLAKVNEEGAVFASSHDSRELVLTPEESIAIQQAIGSDIMMQLDDVLHIKTPSYTEMESSMLRSIRWLDRCIEQWKRSPLSLENQNLFAIVQGGSNEALRKVSVEALMQRDCPGYAIGGLSGGEEKKEFCETVRLCTALLPENKPRYLMGVGYPVDLVVTFCANKVDMCDCVYPLRTSRFGIALTSHGEIDFAKSAASADFSKIDDQCDCVTCQRYTKLSMYLAFRSDRTTGGQLLSLHNMSYMMRLTRNIREAIRAEKLDIFVRDFMLNYFHAKERIPEWVIDALRSSGMNIF